MYVYVLRRHLLATSIGLDCRVSSTNTQNLDVGRPLPFPFQTEITFSRLHSTLSDIASFSPLAASFVYIELINDIHELSNLPTF